MWGFFSWLFDSSDFVTRDCCGGWHPLMVSIYRIGDLTTAVSYFIMPVTLYWLWYKRKDVLPKATFLILFALFIFFCGTGHLLDYLAFTWPAYHLHAVQRMLTGIVSLITAVTLPSAAIYLASLPSPKQFAANIARMEMEIQAREIFQKNLIKRNENLSREADLMKKAIEEMEHKVMTREAVLKLRERLHGIRNA